MCRVFVRFDLMAPTGDALPSPKAKGQSPRMAL